MRVEVAPLLGAVQRVVGRVEIEDDLPGRRAVRLQEQRDHQPVDRRRVGGDPLAAVARRLVRDAELEPVERARAGQRMAAVAVPHPVGAGDVAAADGQRQNAVVAQLVVVVEILVSQRSAQSARNAGARVTSTSANSASLAPLMGNTQDTPGNCVGFGVRKGRTCRAQTPRGLQAVVTTGLSAPRGCLREARFSTPCGVFFTHTHHA